MTVIFSKKCELALQAILYLSTMNPKITVSALEIAAKLKAPKEFISKILQNLTKFGIVASKKGKSGGFSISKTPESIHLIDIVKAVDGLDAFNCCVLGFPGCSVSKPCPLHSEWGILRENTVSMLTNSTLASILEKTKEKMASL